MLKNGNKEGGIFVLFGTCRTEKIREIFCEVLTNGFFCGLIEV